MDIVNKKVFHYSNRKSKAEFVYNRYKNILTGDILDVGADELYLKEHLPDTVNYKGIGFGDHPDLIKIDLEKDEIPFPDNSFDTIICLDVLEHLENIHEMFDKIANLSKKWILISLPNPMAALIEALEKKPFSEEHLFKFYGLPYEKPEDRHKWFFTLTEAKKFIKYKAQKNNLEIADEFIKGKRDGLPKPNGIKNKINRWKIQYARKLLFRKDIDFTDFYAWTYWVVLKK